MTQEQTLSSATNVDMAPNNLVASFLPAAGCFVGPARWAPWGTEAQALAGPDAGQVTSRLRFGELVVDPVSQQVHRAGRAIPLTPAGYRLIVALLNSAPQLVSHARLAHEIHGQAPGGCEELNRHIDALREVLDLPFAWPMLVTIRGVGYRLADADAT